MNEQIAHLRALNDAVQRGDRDEFRRHADAVMHGDCTWEPLIAAVEGREYRGPEGMAAFFEDFVGTFEVEYLEPDFRTVGDDVVVMLASMRVRARESGVEVPRELGVVFEFEDGLVRRGRAYDSRRRALAEAEALHA